LKKQGVVNLMACVTEENANSIKFHEKRGYKEVGTFHKVGFKFNRWLDVTWLQKDLNDRSQEMSPITSWKN
jgi:Sortase and related acyltransferases